MRKTLLLCSLATLMATPALAGPWVRSFAVENYEPAFYYGAKDEPVGRVLSHCFRVPRSTAEGGLHYERRPMSQYSEAELEKIEVRVTEGVVKLLGPIERRYAAHAVRQARIVRGVVDVIDELDRAVHLRLI